MNGLPARARRIGGRAKRAVRQRATQVLRARVEAVRQREERSSIEAEVIDLAFGHGYLIRQVPSGASAEEVTEHVARWPRRSIAGHTYHLHPRTRLTLAGEELVLLGDPVSVEDSTNDPQVIADRLLKVARAEGRDALALAAADLGGRWTLVHHERALDGSSVLALTDALGSQPVFYSTVDGTTMASHEVLVTDTVGQLPEGEVAPHTQLEVRQEPDHETQRADGSAADASTRDYWPSSPPVETTAKEVYPEFRERLIEHVGLLSEIGRPAVELSGARDSSAALESRAILAAHLHHRRPEDLTFTVVNTESARAGSAALAEVFRASRLAQQVGITHRLFRWQEPAEHHPLTLAHAATFPRLTRSLGRASGLWTSLPPGVITLQAGGIDAAPLGQGADREALLQCQETDLSHRALLPFNDRRLLELLRSLPVQERVSRVLLQRLVDERFGSEGRPTHDAPPTHDGTAHA